ncbi:myosin light chain kinase, smooth muscle-like isoform X2 [Ambystoma mexicanum]|uniref:myosin light chain kinase, smooth muscle-like isoform X2 n=1 Tax=Ambystoma mexicanum TaxID=8296 RepID=UPI0037E73A55
MSYVSTLRIDLKKPPRCDGGTAPGEGRKASLAAMVQNGPREPHLQCPEPPAFSRPLRNCPAPERSGPTREGQVTGKPPITVSWLNNDVGMITQSKAPPVSRVMVSSKVTSFSSSSGVSSRVTSVSSTSMVSQVTMAPNGTTKLEKGAVTMVFELLPQHGLTKEVRITGPVTGKEKTCSVLPSRMMLPSILRAKGTETAPATPHGSHISQNHVSISSQSVASPGLSQGIEKSRNSTRPEVTVVASNRTNGNSSRDRPPFTEGPQDCRKADDYQNGTTLYTTSTTRHVTGKESPYKPLHFDTTGPANIHGTSNTESLRTTLAADDSNKASSERGATVSAPFLDTSSRGRAKKHHVVLLETAVTNCPPEKSERNSTRLADADPQDRSKTAVSLNDVPGSRPPPGSHTPVSGRTPQRAMATGSHAALTEYRLPAKVDGVQLTSGTFDHGRAKKHRVLLLEPPVTNENSLQEKAEQKPAGLPDAGPQDSSKTVVSLEDIPGSSPPPNSQTSIQERTPQASRTEKTVATSNHVALIEDSLPVTLDGFIPTSGTVGHGRAKKVHFLPREVAVTSENSPQEKAEQKPTRLTDAGLQDRSKAAVSLKDAPGSSPPSHSHTSNKETTCNGHWSEATPAITDIPEDAAECTPICNGRPSKKTSTYPFILKKAAETTPSMPVEVHTSEDVIDGAPEDDVLDTITSPVSACTSPDSVTPKRRALKSGDALKLVDPVNSVEVNVGDQAELYCGILGSPPIAASWVKQKKQISSGTKTSVETTDSGSKLVIRDVQADDSGCYTLFVRDRTGSIQHQISLSVTDRPQPPSGKPYASALQAETLTLSWSGPCYDGGSAIQYYIVEVKGVGESTWRTLTNSCLSTSYRVKDGLEPQKEYQFRVRAVNAHGTSEPGDQSAVIKMATEEDAINNEPFDYQQVVINTTEKVLDLYTQLEKLGVGKFGQVYRLQEKATGRILAGKFYKTRTAKEKESARMEVELMNKLHHPKLAQCVAAYQTRAEMVMVLEYIAGGELFERIVDDAFEHTEPTCVQYVRQILEGVQYMHQQNIVHLDLKPENIVCVNRTGNNIKIIDFGLARMLKPGAQVKVMQGTPEFIAPEVISFEPIGFTTDMWSIGVICYILLSGDSPFQGNNDMETLRNVTAAQWEFDEETLEEISDRAKDFISKLLKKNMRSRLTTDQALQHPWLQETEQANAKTLSKEKIKKFLARQKWQKTGKAVLALKRMSLLTNKQDNKVTSPDSPQREDIMLSPQDTEVFSFLHQQIQRPPSFSKTLRDQVEVEGSSACLQCHIEGYPDPEVIWFQNDIPIQESGRFRIEYDETGSCSLIISDVTQGDSGRYACKAFNDIGEAEISAKLTVCPLHGVRNR